MNDRFKFRAWYNPGYREPIMLYDVEQTYDYMNGEPESVPADCFGVVLDVKDYIVMQSTDLKDKNGKLIYEGDIVFNNCGRLIIKYCDVCKSFQCFDNTYGCYACDGDYQWCDFIEDLNKTTIEGNIYEHEELLEEYNNE